MTTNKSNSVSLFVPSIDSVTNKAARFSIEKLEGIAKKDVKIISKGFKTVLKKQTTSPSYWAGFFLKNESMLIMIDNKVYRLGSLLAINIEDYKGTAKEKQNLILRSILSGFKFYTDSDVICRIEATKDKDSGIIISKRYVRKEEFDFNGCFNAVCSPLKKQIVEVDVPFDVLTADLLEAKKLELRAAKIEKMQKELSLLTK